MYRIFIEGLKDKQEININKNLTIDNIIASLQKDIWIDYYITFNSRKLNGLDKIKDIMSNEATIQIR